jgi:arylformamidase
MLYRDFATVEAIDAEYNLGVRVPENAEFTDRWARESAAARDSLDCTLGLRFGPTNQEYLDIFPAGGASDQPSPVHVFIHGGYWRRFTAREFSFIAPTLVAAGVTVVVVNYALCPFV